jgi:small subunit ribosomal protein S20
MPIIKSAIKRAKQSLVRRSHNLQVKRAVKADITALHAALAAGDAADIQAKFSAAYSEIDRAVKKHTLHKNTAARRKSQLAHIVAKASGAEVVPAAAKTTKGAGKKAVTTKTSTKKATAAKTATVKKPTTAKKPAAKATPAKKPAAKSTSKADK